MHLQIPEPDQSAAGTAAREEYNRGVEKITTFPVDGKSMCHPCRVVRMRAAI